jgi:hypothetical protein
MFIDEYITKKKYCVQMLLESRRWGVGWGSFSSTEAAEFESDGAPT